MSCLNLDQSLAKAEKDLYQSRIALSETQYRIVNTGNQKVIKDLASLYQKQQKEFLDHEHRTLDQRKLINLTNQNLKLKDDFITVENVQKDKASEPFKAELKEQLNVINAAQIEIMTQAAATIKDTDVCPPLTKAEPATKEPEKVSKKEAVEEATAAEEATKEVSKKETVEVPKIKVDVSKKETAEAAPKETVSKKEAAQAAAAVETAAAAKTLAKTKPVTQTTTSAPFDLQAFIQKEIKESFNETKCPERAPKGYHRDPLDRIARRLGLNPKHYTKEELCRAIARKLMAPTKK